MKINDIRQKFLDFFEKHGHKIIANASLVPREDDPTGLFTNSGMHPLKPYFLGKLDAPARRMANAQRCVRTGDIDDVGHDGRHLTFFEMLGNWSIGDYWKTEAIDFTWDFLVNELKMNPERLTATVFAGDEKLGVSADEESIAAWKKYLPDEKIKKLGAEDNFWAGGPTGPCGPCTEIYFEQDLPPCGEKCGIGFCECDRFLEIWNAAVCMEFDRRENGKLEKLPFRSVDAGAGLERIASVLQNVTSAYDTDGFLPIISAIREISREKFSERFDPENKNWQNVAIVADHARTVVFMLADGIEPGNIERGYILRRLIRRAVRAGYNLGVRDNFLAKIADKVIVEMGGVYPHLVKNAERIKIALDAEETRFARTLERGIREFEKIVARIS